MTKPKTTLILTYNNVSGYPAGLYKSKNNTVYLHSQDDSYYEHSPEKLSELIHGLDSKVDLEKIDETIVYAGLNAMDKALNVALNFSEKCNTKIVACNCHYNEKREFSECFGINLISSECGGKRTLKEIMNELLSE